MSSFIDQKLVKSVFGLNRSLLPIAVYDVEIVRKQKEILEGSFRDQVGKFTIAYSYKTNTFLGSSMLQLGCSFQVTSIGHLREVQKLIKGETSSRIIFNSRSLTFEELREVMNSGAHLVINSLHQYDLVKEYAKKKKQTIKIGVRVDTLSSPKNTFFKTINTGLGLTVQEIRSLPLKSKETEIIGLHTHIASQNTDILSVKKGAEVLYKIFEQNNFSFRYLNLGGGFPIQYDKPVPLITEFADNINPTLKKIYKQNPDFEFVIEPGRFIVGNAGFLFVTVTDTMVHGLTNIAVVNSSIFSSVRDRILSKYDIKLPCITLGKQAKKLKKYLIVGSSPSSCDVFGDYRLPSIEVGDVLVFTQAGAYCLSNDNFTGVERPQEYIWLNGRLVK